MFAKFARLLVVTSLLSPVALPGQHKGPQAREPFTIRGDEGPAVRLNGPILPAPWSLGPGDSIAFTFYDYGTNGSALRNLINYGDGTLALARMAAVDSGAFGWLTRGSYYKYFDGSVWIPATWDRIDDEGRCCGWTNIDQIADAGGVEVIVSHPLRVYVHVGGGWSPTILSCTMNLWPRLAIGSGLGIHLVATAGPADLGYHVSLDAGVTWTCDQFLFTHPGIVDDADSYDITAKGSNVAIVDAGAGGDVVLVESMDRGTTWTETVIWDVDETGGTAEEVPDGSVSMLYDSNDILHIAWGNFYNDGTATFFYSVDAGIRHWSSSTGTVQEVAFPDPDTTIVPPYGRDGNLATQPDLSADPNGNVYIIFSRFINEVDVNGYYYEHVFGITSSDGGATWTDPSDLTPGTGYDASFPSVADLADADGSLHIVYNCDPYAGNFLAATPGHPDIAVAVMYLRTMVTDVREDGGIVPSAYRLEQNYPNPFNPNTNIRYRIPSSVFVSLRVFDILGREVATLLNKHQEAGSHVSNLDATNLSSGVYFYMLKAGTFTETMKMIVLK
jgi:hypothetical protein